MRGAVEKFGELAGIVIPDPLLAEFGAVAGDSVDLRIEAGRLVIRRVGGGPRQGWAEDAKRSAEGGDDALVWPDVANDLGAVPAAVLADTPATLREIYAE